MSLLKRIKNIIRSNINFTNSANTWGYEHYSEQNNNSYQDNDDLSFDSAQTQKNDIEKEYYGNLEIPYGSGFEDIKKAYRKLLKKYHPDKFQNDEKKLKIAQEVVKKLNTAYEYFEKKYN